MARRNREKKQRKKAVSPLDGTGISGTKELRDKIDAMGATHIGHDKLTNQAFRQNLVQVPLDYYAMKDWVTKRQYDAGEEFHKLWYHGAVKLGFAAMKLDRVQGGEANYDFAEGCRRKYENAKKAFRGLAQALICYNVCCMGEWATKVTPLKAVVDGYASDPDRAVLRSSQTRRMDWLRDGLDDLADHFKLPR